ncbi:MAG: hypothetical protein NW201_12810 [Gemmatimonadales bacterium]|nr:hypothetical protein [Gemmatimonadales bacterium]
MSTHEAPALTYSEAVMRWQMAVAIGLLATTQATAQQGVTLRPAAGIRNVTKVALHVRTLVEGDRLRAVGGFDEGAVIAQLGTELRAKGIELVADAQADARLDVTLVCAGPDAGTVGCSVDGLLFDMVRDAGGRAQPGALSWASARRYHARAGWRAMAADAGKFVGETTGDFVKAQAQVKEVARS